MRTAGRLPEPVEIAAYYFISEALTNVTKHAHATAITVIIEADAKDHVLRIAVRDDGVGGADFTKGTGLIGLKDRVEALSGRILLDSPRTTAPGSAQSSRSPPRPLGSPRVESCQPEPGWWFPRTTWNGEHPHQVCGGREGLNQRVGATGAAERAGTWSGRTALVLRANATGFWAGTRNEPARPSRCQPRRRPPRRIAVGRDAIPMVC